MRATERTRIWPSFPPCPMCPASRTNGDVEPRSRSELFSCSVFDGVQLPRSDVASAERRRTASPKFVVPFHGALPVATSRLPVNGSTTAPLRPQMAESLAPQDGGSISPFRFEHSEFQTCRSLPLAPSMIATWPWYGGASPMYPPVVAITRPFA